MDRDEARTRGAALRAFLAARLPVPGARSVTALARKAGIQPTTASSWWTQGYVPDNNSLRLLADALGVELSDLVAAYEGSSGPTWVFTKPRTRGVDRSRRRYDSSARARGTRQVQVSGRLESKHRSRAFEFAPRRTAGWRALEEPAE
jgi:transcriptional regulator with XRE-family HTH domain